MVFLLRFSFYISLHDRILVFLQIGWCWCNSQSTCRKQFWNFSVLKIVVIKNLINSWSLGRILHQYFSNDILCIISKDHSRRKVPVIFCYTRISFLNIRGLERWLSNEHGVHDDANCPNINFIRVPMFLVNHFWRYIIWGTTHSPFLLTFEV